MEIHINHQPEFEAYLSRDYLKERSQGALNLRITHILNPEETRVPLRFD